LQKLNFAGLANFDQQSAAAWPVALTEMI